MTNSDHKTLKIEFLSPPFDCCLSSDKEFFAPKIYALLWRVKLLGRLRAKPIGAESLDAGKRAVYCIPVETNDDLWIFVFEISSDNSFRSIVRVVQLRGCKTVILKLSIVRSSPSRTPLVGVWVPYWGWLGNWFKLIFNSFPLMSVHQCVFRSPLPHTWGWHFPSEDSFWLRQSQNRLRRPRKIDT